MSPTHENSLGAFSGNKLLILDPSHICTLPRLIYLENLVIRQDICRELVRLFVLHDPDLPYWTVEFRVLESVVCSSCLAKILRRLNKAQEESGTTQLPTRPFACSSLFNLVVQAQVLMHVENSQLAI